MKKSAILSFVGCVIFIAAMTVVGLTQKGNVQLPIWGTIASTFAMLAGGIFVVLGTDKAAPNYKTLRVVFGMIALLGIIYTLGVNGVIPKHLAAYTDVAILIIGCILAFKFDENMRLKKTEETEPEIDETTQPAPITRKYIPEEIARLTPCDRPSTGDDVTVIGDKEGDAVVVEVNPDNGVEVQVPEEFLDRVASLDENGNIRLSKDGYGDVVITPEGVVTGEVPESLYIPDLDNQEGWKNVYQGIRERLEEDPFKK